MSKSVDKGASFMNRASTFNFHDAGVFHDRVLLVEGKKFYVQSGYLAVWSEFFRTLFNSDFQEKDKSEIELKDVSADGFEVFLKVIYPVFFEVRAFHIESLITLSHHFLAPHVLEICTKFIDKEFDQINKIMLYKVAVVHEMESLKKRAMHFIEDNIYSLDLIDLLNLAFDYDLTELKTDLRSLIYTAEREEKGHICYRCPRRIKNPYCALRGHLTDPLTRNSLIANYMEEISKLSLEIQNFVLRASIDYE